LKKIISIILIFTSLTLLSGCGDEEEIIKNLTNENNELKISIAKFSTAENAQIITLRSELKSVNEKNQQTKEQLNHEYKAEFTEKLSNRIGKEIFWSTFWYIVALIVTLALITFSYINKYKKEYGRKLNDLKHAHNNEILKHENKVKDLQMNLKNMSDKKTEREEEIMLRTVLGKKLNEALISIESNQ